MMMNYQKNRNIDRNNLDMRRRLRSSTDSCFLALTCVCKCINKRKLGFETLLSVFE